jgi:hypothetical protein
LNIPQYAGGGASTFSGLSDATSAALTVDEIYLQATTRLIVTANGSSAYLFDQYTGNNPTVYATSGTTIAFDLGTGALSSHPFLIRLSGANYNTGLTHVTSSGVITTGSSAQGKTSGTLYWKIPADISGTYGYLCSNHGSMAGTITINPVTVTATSLSLGNVTNESKATMFTSPTLSNITVNGGVTFGSAITFSGSGYQIGKDGADFLCFSGGSAGTRFINASTATEWMRFDSSGNVGIGATTNNVFDAVAVARPLVVQKSDTSTTLNGSTAAITIANSDTTTSNTAQLNFAAITGASASQYSSAIISCIFGARTNTQYPTGQLVFSTSTSLNTAPTEKMRIDSAGLVTIASGQIKFPASQNASSDANTLDDYEEGTYTPSVTGSTSGGPFTFSTQSGYYTKIGREVKVSMFMSHNSTVTFAGAYKISLPFTVADYAGGGFVSYVSNWTSQSPKQFQVEASTTYGYLRGESATEMLDLQQGYIGNNTSYMLTIIYKTT